MPVKTIILHFRLHNSCIQPIPSSLSCMDTEFEAKPSHNYTQLILMLLTLCLLFYPYTFTYSVTST